MGEDAALILAELSASESMDQLEQAFVRSPTFFQTLVRLIEKCARAGELERIPSLFDLAQSDRPGLWFCKGLFSIYKGEPQKALEYLNRCRQDPDWGLQAMQLIFHIYANPNRKCVWCESRPLASDKDLTQAGKFLKKFDSTAIDTRQMEAALLLSQNTTESVTKALEIYEQGDDDDIRQTLAKCQCYLRLNRQRDATRSLNGIIHGEPTHATFSLFVRAFLMMAFVSMKDGHGDEAEKYAQKAVDMDKSCAKGWEIKGILAENRKEFLPAADAFRRAWELSGLSDLGVGFKLALNYMRGEEPVEAIKIARAIFAKHPNYPKLKELIFLPCCAALRP
jgi:tetratricopeptide repeat protein 21B